MTTNTNNTSFQVAFLRKQRLFPEEAQPLSVEVDRAYTDIANATNIRPIGIFPTIRSIQIGEGWYFSSKQQSSFRQIYPFAVAGNIAHGIAWSGVYAISPRSYGSFTDGTNWYGVSYGSSTSIGGQVSFYVTPSNLVIVSDGAAPTIVSGFVDLEWIVTA